MPLRNAATVILVTLPLVAVIQVVVREVCATRIIQHLVRPILSVLLSRCRCRAHSRAQSRHQPQYRAQSRHQPQALFPHLHPALVHLMPSVVGVPGETLPLVEDIQVVEVVVSAQLIGPSHVTEMRSAQRNRCRHQRLQRHRFRLLRQPLLLRHQRLSQFRHPHHVEREALSCSAIWRIGGLLSSGGMRTCQDIA